MRARLLSRRFRPLRPAIGAGLAVNVIRLN